MGSNHVRLSSMAHGGGSGCRLSPACFGPIGGRVESSALRAASCWSGDRRRRGRLADRRKTCLISTTDSLRPWSMTRIQAAGFDEARILGEMVEGSGAVVS